jgi:hypothetical protein
MLLQSERNERKANGETTMPEVSSTDAAQILGIGEVTVRRHVYNDRLNARRIGVRKIMRIDLDELRQLAAEYQYRFDEDLAKKLAK